MTERESFAASGEIALPSGQTACSVTVTADGLAVSDGSRTVVEWPAHEIDRVEREDYDVIVTNVFDAPGIVLRRFARRTDELETALRLSRADALAQLMAPPGKSPMDLFEAAGERPGLLYRYDDGLRWVPHEGDCGARMYSELHEAAFDPDAWELVLRGPFGETRIAGLRRLARELASETTRYIAEAREAFAAALEAAGLPWGDEARSGEVSAHVPFEATGARLKDLSESGIICDARRAYWRILVEASVVERVVLSPGDEGLRAVALCRVADGELYETLSESDHATFVFEDADRVVRAWTEAGFRREPIFSPSERDDAAALARVLPSLNAARRGLLSRVIHDEPGQWKERLLR
ncbi:MAG: hypothetical protein ACOCX2_14265 [Armatimonadota bacterium]